MLHPDVDHPPALLCPHCGYNVAIISGERCPECGGTFSRALLRRERDRTEQSRLWQPVTLVLTFPLTVAILVGLTARPLGWMFLPAAMAFGAFIVLGCVVFSLAASGSLAKQLQQRGIGLGHSRERLASVVALLSFLLQIAIMAAGVAVAYAISGPWRMPI